MIKMIKIFLNLQINDNWKCEYYFMRVFNIISVPNKRLLKLDKVKY